MTGDVLNPHLPDGVVRARLGAVMEERAATAQVIIDLEKLVINERNLCIRVRTVLMECKSKTRPAILAAINEALEIIGHE